VTDVFGVRIDRVTSTNELRSQCERFLAGDHPGRIFTPNPEILLRARVDPGYAEVLNTADLSLPDGIGLAFVATLRDRGRVRRWPGIDVGELLLLLARDRGDRVVFVGGARGAATRAADRWRRRLPGLALDVVGDDVPIDDDGRAATPDLDDAVTGSVAALSPRVVFVGLGAPKQERWVARHAGSIPSARVLIGLGGAFDIWAGDLPRAPDPLRRLGLEWAWRLVLEPRRWRRAVRATVVFPVRVAIDRLRSPRDAAATRRSSS